MAFPLENAVLAINMVLGKGKCKKCFSYFMFRPNTEAFLLLLHLLLPVSGEWALRKGVLGSVTVFPLRLSLLSVIMCPGLLSALALGFSSLPGYVSLYHARVQNQGTTFSNSSIGNKADILISIWLFPLSSLSRCQTLKIGEQGFISLVKYQPSTEG